MSLLMPHVAARIFDTPLMVAEAKAVAMLVGMGGRIVDGGVVFAEGVQAVEHIAFENGRPSAGKVGDRLGRAYDREGARPFDKVENVAVIGVEGTLVHKGAYVGQSSGRTSYQGLQTQIVRAARDPSVKGVVFEVDSFGGEVAGAFETADLIAQLSAIKPTMAILTDFGLSAGYLLAAPTRQVVLPESGSAGSIGVVSMHIDASKKLEKDGLAVTVISSGAHKVDGHPFAALPDDVRQRVQARNDTQRERFAAAVGRYRGRRLSKAQAMDTEAQVYDGPQSVALGLADATGHASDAFAAFVRAVNR